MIYQGDCLDILPTLEANSIDSIVTDPPYGLSFMGKDWDHGVPGVHFWVEALRVAKPGAYLLAFGGTRTFHRLAVAIEDAGWEIRDCLGWLYGSGFPKSHNIGNGFGTALKPAWEPIILARKPFKSTVADNVLKYGTGAINIDGCRVDTFQPGELDRLKARADTPRQDFTGGRLHSGAEYTPKIIESGMSNKGRWPANLIHDGSQEVLELFPNTGNGVGQRTYDGSGSAARFFYCAKASKAERNRGCEGLEEKIQNNTETNSRTFNDRCLTCKKKFVGSDNTICHCPPELKITDKTIYTNKNNHPTIKPIALMEYLVKLVTREGQTVLDPFAGSGTTGIACKNLNRNAILIEREGDYIEIAGRRISAVQPLFDGI